MGLNKINDEFLKFAKVLGKAIPTGKNSIGMLSACLIEMSEGLTYEDKPENNKRYPFKNKNVKVDSMLSKAKEASKLLSSKKSIDYETLLDVMYFMYVKLQWHRWSVNDARRSIKRIINLIEKEIDKSSEK